MSVLEHGRKTDRTSHHSPMVLVQSGSIPEAIEFFLDAPADVLSA
jgi:hypothetical protein